MYKHTISLIVCALASFPLFSQSETGGRDIEPEKLGYQPELMTFSQRDMLIYKSRLSHSTIWPSNEWVEDPTPTTEHYGFNDWVWRKLFDEDLIRFSDSDYSITINPILQLNGGVEFTEDSRLLGENGRGVRVAGHIGRQFRFESKLIESQVFAPGYINNFISQRRVVPGQGIARPFYTDGWDHRWASGNISYTPSKYFNFSLGQGRFFYGEGYRSLFLSDNALNYPYFRIETTVGPFKYVNLWTQMYDIRPSVNLNPGNRKKWISTHYLSWNVNDRLNLNLFEAVVLRSDTTNGGFDASYFNPIILYRPVEDQIDSRLGNALIGAGASYDLLDELKVYSQFILDEFNFSAIRASEGSWLNKFGYQLGAQYINSPFDDPNQLYSIRVEWNRVRPFTYTHVKTLTNYGHYNQPLAHPLGTDFDEWLIRGNYIYKRWMFTIHYSRARRGLAENSAGVYYSEGTNLWTSYSNRSRDIGFSATDNPSTIIQNIRAQAAYEFNPRWKMNVFAMVGYRSGATYPFTVNNGVEDEYSGLWFSMGIRTDLYRSFSDF